MDKNRPEYIERFIDLESMLKQKSYFLFGPRQTGKSTLVQHKLPAAKVYNLLDNTLFLEFNSRPGRLKEEVSGRDNLVVIDEIQRVPQLLNEVHLLIEKGVRFLLTGSSARKLRSGGVNLLGGRAREAYLHPFVTAELGKLFDLDRALNAGLIPSIYFSNEPKKDLASYVGAYLKTEIAAEALTRNVPAFSRFLGVAALCNAKIVNFSNVSNDAQVKRTTVYEYFEILKDTLLLRELAAFRKGRNRKPVCSSKYYFFDTGVARQLQGRVAVTPGTPEYGDAFETFIINEVFAFSDYVRPLNLSFWRTTTRCEVDLIIDDSIALEIKGKPQISQDDLKGLNAIAEEGSFKRYICVSLDKRPRKSGKIEILHYNDFLEMLWARKLC
jgi:predicted AAA+ superfamily ATPase